MMAEVMTLEERAEQQKTEIREILAFVKDNIRNLTPLHFDAKRKKVLREHVSVWRWYVSHGYFEEKDDPLNRDKPPISWLHNLLVSHRAVRYLITLLAAPGVTESFDLKNGADILMLKMSRILTYSTPQEIPSTFYLPPSDPKKTDQYGVPWAKSDSKAAKKWRIRLKSDAKARKSLQPKPKPVLSEQEARERAEEYLAVKNAQRKVERDRRDAAKEDADRRYEAEKREEEKRRLEKLGNKT